MGLEISHPEMIMLRRGQPQIIGRILLEKMRRVTKVDCPDLLVAKYVSAIKSHYVVVKKYQHFRPPAEKKNVTGGTSDFSY